MRWKTTAVLAVLLVGLGTFFYVYEVRQGPAREEAASEKDRLWKDLETKDVDDLVVKRGGETVHLKRSGTGWVLAAPVEARAEARPVDDLVSSLASARVERQIDATPSKLADYGLEPAAAEITFKAKGQERGIRLGAKSPTGIWVYAQEAGKPAVFLAPDSLLRDAQKSATDFRDRTVLAFERASVKGLEVKTAAGQTLAAQLKGTDAWQMTAPRAVTADREQISSLLEKLRAAKIKEFVADGPTASAGAYGRDRPLAVTLWVGEEKERAAKTLRLGKAVPEKKAVYAQREGEATVFLVDEALLKAIPASATALRDKTVFVYDRDKLERVELESPKGKVTLALEGGVWRITAPIAVKADEGAMSTLLGQARDLRAKDFVAEDATRLAQFGLDKPEVRLTVWEKEAKEPKTLLLAPAKGREEAYAAAPGGGQVALVTAKALSDLGRSAQDLRDRSLFGGLDTQAVTRVQIQRGDQTLTVERKGGEDDWQLVAPKRGKARGSRVSDLVWTLRNLRWRDLVAEQGWEPGRYGLDPPATTITLFGKDGKTLAALAVGKRDANDAYVRVPGQPVLYAIEAKNLGELPASAEDLLL